MKRLTLSCKPAVHCNCPGKPPISNFPPRQNTTYNRNPALSLTYHKFPKTPKKFLTRHSSEVISSLAQKDDGLGLFAYQTPINLLSHITYSHTQ